MTPALHPPPRHCRKSARNRQAPDWLQTLPAEWREAAIAPLEFTRHRDYELPASRTLGYDEDHQPCYYRHLYVIGSLHSDDDEEFYEVVAYGEEVEAWRLRDGRWLIWRIAHEDGACNGNRGFYSFSEEMPK